MAAAGVARPMPRRRPSWLPRVLAWGALCAGGATLSAAGADEPAEAPQAPLDVETILANPLGAEDYRRGQRCLGSRSYRDIEVLDEHNLLFVGRRQTWLNRLRTRCVGLRPNMMIYLDVRGSRICHMDDFRARHRVGAAFPTPTCVLGEFEELDAAQVQGLRDAVPLPAVGAGG